MKNVLMLLVAWVICINAQAQYYPNIQRAIPQYVNGYDSVILFYFLSTNGMRRENKIGGYGVNHGRVYKIRLTLKEGGNAKGFASDDPQFGSIEETLEQDSLTIQAIRQIKFSSVLHFNNDSLNAKPECCSASDAGTSVLFVKTNSKHRNLLAYVPEYYQPYLPTQDRQDFIEVKESICSHFEIPFTEDLVKRSMGWDSLILIRNWDYGSGKMGYEMNGFAMKGDTCFRLKVALEYPFLNGDMVIKSLEQTNSIDKSIGVRLKTICFSCVGMYDKGELDKGIDNVYPPTSRTTGLYVVTNHVFSTNEAFEPVFEQKQIATNDRKDFIHTMEVLNNLIGE